MNEAFLGLILFIDVLNCFVFMRKSKHIDLIVDRASKGHLTED